MTQIKVKTSFSLLLSSSQYRGELKMKEAHFNRKEVREMKKLAIIAFFLAVLFAPVFAGAEDGLLELGWEDHDSGRVVTVHFHDSLYGAEADIVRDALWEVEDRLPVGESYLAVVRFPEVGRYHVRLSDSIEHVVYAVGTGDTFRSAAADLIRVLKLGK